MSKKLVATMVLVAFFIGTLGSVIFNRLVFPYLSTVNGFHWVGRLQSSAPIVISRREEVRLNEGVNLIELTKQAQTVVVSIYSSGDNPVFLGNGLVISSDGIIFTTKEILGPNTAVKVVTNAGNAMSGTVRALDPKSPLAVVTVQGKDLPVAQFSDAGSMQTAQRIFVLGRTNQEFTRIFASGLVTKSLSNQTDESRVLSSDVFENTIRSDAVLSADYDGGPAVNLQGLVIGMIAGSGTQIVTAEAIEGAIKTYFSSGRIQRPYLGFKYSSISKNLAAVRVLTNAGGQVIEVDPQGAAGKAGLLAQDLVIEINNRKVEDSSLEQLLVENDSAEVSVTVLRGPQLEEIELKIKPDLR